MNNTAVRDARREQEQLDALHRLDEECVHLQRAGNYLQAFDRMERALVLRRHFFGADSPDVAHACRALAEMCNLLSMSFLQQDNYAVTIELLKKAEILAQHHPKETATTLNNLACYYRRLGKLHTAMTCLKKALTIETKTLRDARLAADTHLNMCAVLSQLGRHEPALAHAQAALATLQSEFFQKPPHEAKDAAAPSEHTSAQLERASVMCIAYHNVGVEQEFLKDFEGCVLSYKKGVGLAEQYLGVDHAIATTIRNSYLAAKRTISTKAAAASARHACKAAAAAKMAPLSPRGSTPPVSVRLPSPTTKHQSQQQHQRPELPSPRSIVADALARGNTLPPLDTPKTKATRGKLLPDDPFFSPRFRFDADGTPTLVRKTSVGKTEGGVKPSAERAEAGTAVSGAGSNRVEEADEASGAERQTLAGYGDSADTAERVGEDAKNARGDSTAASQCEGGAEEMPAANAEGERTLEREEEEEPVGGDREEERESPRVEAIDEAMDRAAAHIADTMESEGDAVLVPTAESEPLRNEHGADRDADFLHHAVDEAPISSDELVAGAAVEDSAVDALGAGEVAQREIADERHSEREFSHTEDARERVDHDADHATDAPAQTDEALHSRPPLQPPTELDDERERHPVDYKLLEGGSEEQERDPSSLQAAAPATHQLDHELHDKQVARETDEQLPPCAEVADEPTAASHVLADPSTEHGTGRVESHGHDEASKEQHGKEASGEHDGSVSLAANDGESELLHDEQAVDTSVAAVEGQYADTDVHATPHEQAGDVLSSGAETNYPHELEVPTTGDEHVDDCSLRAHGYDAVPYSEPHVLDDWVSYGAETEHSAAHWHGEEETHGHGEGEGENLHATQDYEYDPHAPLTAYEGYHDHAVFHGDAASESGAFHYEASPEQTHEAEGPHYPDPHGDDQHSSAHDEVAHSQEAGQPVETDTHVAMAHE